MEYLINVDLIFIRNVFIRTHAPDVISCRFLGFIGGVRGQITGGLMWGFFGKILDYGMGTYEIE